MQIALPEYSHNLIKNALFLNDNDIFGFAYGLDCSTSWQSHNLVLSCEQSAAINNNFSSTKDNAAI